MVEISMKKRLMRQFIPGTLMTTINAVLFAGLLLAGLIFAQLSTLPTFAQEKNYDLINRIAHKMNCPTCTGINLADCRTQTCSQWKEQISDLVDEGYSEQEVLDFFVAQYGTQVLQEPPKSGFTLSLWVLPIIMILLGGTLLFFTMRQWNNSRQPVTETTGPEPVTTKKETASTPAPASDPYLQQVENDLGLD
jgi:cytochrome c-type biogenesis protein CcmH